MTTPLLGSSQSSQEIKNLETIAHLESMVASAEILQSTEEYKHWLTLYVKKLTELQLEDKLNELCHSFLGSPGFSTNWNPKILGIPKRQLVKEFLPIIGSNRNLQRLANQIGQSLEAIAE